MGSIYQRQLGRDRKRGELETRAQLSGPFLPTARHKAEKEKESGGKPWHRSRRETRTSEVSWGFRQDVETSGVNVWCQGAEENPAGGNLDCLHTATHTRISLAGVHTSIPLHAHCAATCLRSRQPRSRLRLWWSWWACRPCWRRSWQTTGLCSARGWRGLTRPAKRPTLASGGCARRPSSSWRRTLRAKVVDPSACLEVGSFWILLEFDDF